MTNLLSLLALSLVSTSAMAAELSLSKELNCEAADGTKLLINSPLAGGAGKALVASGRSLRATAMRADRSATILLDTGVRSASADYKLSLDIASANLTSRQEGADSVYYIYVPGVMKASGQEVALKCLQEAN